MNEKRPFKEIIEELGVKRQTAQGWVTDILELYGYSDYSKWEFSDEEIKKLWKIKLWKELNYSNKKIKELLTKNASCDIKELDNTIIELEKKRKELENTIQVAKTIRDYGISPSMLRFNAVYSTEIPYQSLKELISKVFCDEGKKDEYINEKAIDDFLDEHFEKIELLIESIIENGKEGISYKMPLVQEKVKDIYDLTSLLFSKSIISFYWLVRSIFIEDQKNSYFMFSKRENAYLKKATLYFCKMNANNEYDKTLENVFDKIQELALKRYNTFSKEVQCEVNRYYSWLLENKIYTKAGVIKSMKNISEWCESEIVIQEMDGGRTRGVFWFISRAFEFYIKNLKTNDEF